MIRFQFVFEASHSIEWPKINIFHNNKSIKTHDCSNPVCEFEISPEHVNNLEIHYFNKIEKHTQMKDGKIINDQFLELKSAYADGILLESWFINDGNYQPSYFKNFVENYKNNRTNEPLQKTLKSQTIWHFPGKFLFPPFTNNFYDWYFQKMNSNIEINFLNKDPQRIEKFKGSLEPHNEIVNELKKYI